MSFLKSAEAYTTSNYIAILGRQPELSVAELAAVSEYVEQLSPHAALVEHSPDFDIEQLGGCLKLGLMEASVAITQWQALTKIIVEHCRKKYLSTNGKLTIGLSVYGGGITSREVHGSSLSIKQALAKRDGSVRLIPNEEPALTTATSHHNKLGLSEKKVELLIIITKNKTYIATSIGAQNITAFARRDQGRPKRDAFVGMLPPKLALMMVNLSGVRPNQSSQVKDSPTVLDPFCGTGVILQEAALRGFNVYGSDLAEKMVSYATDNLAWLEAKHALKSVRIEHGDAIEHGWETPIHAVVSEVYLGQPFSAPPAPDKLQKVVRICNDITTKFLTNLHSQIEPGTPLCLAVPAWRDKSGRITQLPLVRHIEKHGYEYQKHDGINAQNLLYYRENQVVARQLLILHRK